MDNTKRQARKRNTKRRFFFVRTSFTTRQQFESIGLVFGALLRERGDESLGVGRTQRHVARRVDDRCCRRASQRNRRTYGAAARVDSATSRCFHRREIGTRQVARDSRRRLSEASSTALLVALLTLELELVFLREVKSRNNGQRNDAPALRERASRT